MMSWSSSSLRHLRIKQACWILESSSQVSSDQVSSNPPVLAVILILKSSASCSSSSRWQLHGLSSTAEADDWSDKLAEVRFEQHAYLYQLHTKRNHCRNAAIIFVHLLLIWCHAAASCPFCKYKTRSLCGARLTFCCH